MLPWNKQQICCHGLFSSRSSHFYTPLSIRFSFCSLLHNGLAALECFDFVLNSILFPPQSRNFVKTLNYKTKIYQNFVKTLNYKTMIKLSIKTLILIIAFESHKKESSKRKACHKDLNIYDSMPRTTNFKFKNCQKLLDVRLEKKS